MKKAKIESEYNFNQTVYYLDGLFIREGEVKAIKGAVDFEHDRKDIELQIEVKGGGMAMRTWVKEEDCVNSSEMIINKILNNSELSDI